MSKQKVASPTIQLESLLLSLFIDVNDNRDVATSYVVGAYLLVDTKDHVIVKLSGKIVEVMCKVNTKYIYFITQDNGKQALYLKLKKALYRCIQSAIFWYRTFKGCLEDTGFKLNKYDACVANKTIAGNKCTICWYVDDIKISHEDPTLVDEVISKIEDRLGKMTVNRGEEHNFVGTLV